MEAELFSLFDVQNLKKINESSTFRLIARHKVAANLRASYTPQLAVRLLVNCDLWLEVCLFVDHFNDLRSALIVRHLVDLNCGYAETAVVAPINF
ncbi:hypothetical protein M3Y98_00236000 [Aphelenchoides besseyi]|nr:hypothetical protein M3Y98_00236000 [Aphelenchoides besseyi]